MELGRRASWRTSLTSAQGQLSALLVTRQSIREEDIPSGKECSPPHGRHKAEREALLTEYALQIHVLSDLVWRPSPTCQQLIQTWGNPLVRLAPLWSNTLRVNTGVQVPNTWCSVEHPSCMTLHLGSWRFISQCKPYLVNITEPSQS